MLIAWHSRITSTNLGFTSSLLLNTTTFHSTIQHLIGSSSSSVPKVPLEAMANVEFDVVVIGAGMKDATQDYTETNG